jgi:hypothetical protein
MKILRVIHRYPFLPTKHIHALVGGNKSNFGEVMTQLRHEHQLIDLKWHGKFYLTQEAVWFLTPTARRMAKTQNFWLGKSRKGAWAAHETGSSIFDASFEIGASLHGLEYINDEWILNGPDCPPATRQMKEPFVLHTSFDYKPRQGKEVHIKKDVESDGRFFGLALSHNDGTQSVMYFPGHEFDNDSEPLEPEDYERPNIAGKFLQYRQLARELAYQKRFGIEGFVIPFVTIGSDRMYTLMRCLERITNGKGSKLFIFTYVDDYRLFGTYPPPNGDMLARNYKRVGYPDYNIINELKAGD